MFLIIFDLILIGIHNDGLDQSQKKIPESTEMSSAINEEDFDEEENVKVRQTRATYIELKVKNTLGEIFMQNLFQLNPIFSSFRPNILSGMIFKFSLFILNIFLICFSNAYFYSEDLFEKRIELFVNKYPVQNFLYPFSRELVKIIISSIISIYCSYNQSRFPERGYIENPLHLRLSCDIINLYVLGMQKIV